MTTGRINQVTVLLFCCLNKKDNKKEELLKDFSVFTHPGLTI